MEKNVDVVVVGGGAAGYAGAVALARSRRMVLLVDAGDQRNISAGHVHNFLTRDGMPPAELYAAGRAEFQGYGGQLITGRVEAIARDGELFRMTVGEDTITARGVLVATGARDELPDVPGLAEQWGRGVIHCPYCHGWEVRDRRIGVLATGPTAVHQALLFRQLSADVTLLVHAGEAPSGQAADQLDALGIAVVAGPVVAVQSGGGVLTGAQLADGRVVALDALVVASFVRARAELLAPLGIETAEFRVGEHAVATHVPPGPSGTTSVPGLYVAGNVAEPMAQVITAAAAGLMAGAALNIELITRDAAAAAQRQRDHFWSEQAWDDRYREHPQRFSGAPNAALVAEVSGLAPGSALDAGAGEGGDATWLAQQGWTVTAADLSQVALERAASAAAAAGVTIEAAHLDLTAKPAPGRYDLVTSSYVHVPGDLRRLLFTRLAAAVAPGGTLLVVGHDLSDLSTSVPRQRLAEAGWTAEHVAATLGDGWVVDTCAALPRTVTNPHGEQVTVHDAVLRAHRVD
ncbi:MAG: SAM-dependent methyltransferase [Pseudonocardiales bacterium]|nr:MAG: SAM-dependent methyltransferase [Pseudonocardiales bacterium]